MTTDDSALIFFDAPFAVVHTDWIAIEYMFTQRYDSKTKQEEVSGEMTLLKLNDFKVENNKEKKALIKL